MPVYEYYCRTCSTKHDRLRSMSEADDPTTCPHCGETNSVRALSVFITHSSGTTSERSGGDMRASTPAGGGCCGGMCGCGGHSVN